MASGPRRPASGTRDDRELAGAKQPARAREQRPLLSPRACFCARSSDPDHVDTLSCLPPQTADLLVNKPAVNTVAAHQLIRRTVLHNLSALQNNNAVEVAYRREPVRNCYDGSSTHQ